VQFKKPGQYADMVKFASPEQMRVLARRIARANLACVNHLLTMISENLQECAPDGGHLPAV
jgi:hypothetical protein